MTVENSNSQFEDVAALAEGSNGWNSRATKASVLQVSGTSKTAQATQRRLDRAHARYLSAIKALATTHKLLRPGLSPLQLAAKFVPEEQVGIAGLQSATAPTVGVPVLN